MTDNNLEIFTKVALLNAALEREGVGFLGLDPLTVIQNSDLRVTIDGHRVHATFEMHQDGQRHSRIIDVDFKDLP